MEYSLDLGYLQDIECNEPVIDNLTDRFAHTYVLGQTGMGKSVLMERMAAYDISHGLSVIYIDPKGDSVKKLYRLAENKEKVRYISIDNPMTINPLQKRGYDDNVIIDEFRQILDILVMLTTSNPESTVLMSELIEMSISGFSKEQRQLDYFLDFLMYEKVRKKHRFTDPRLAEYWEDFDAFDRNIRRNKDKIESAKRVASRLLKICRGKMKDIVIGENEFDVTDILENGQSLLIDTSRMGDEARIIYVDAMYPGIRNINVVYSAGYAAADIPNPIKTACMKMIAKIYNKRRSDGFSSEEVANARVDWDKFLSSDIEDLLSPYKKRKI